MKKVIIIFTLFLISVSFLTGCQSPDINSKENIKSTMVEISCKIAKPISEKMKTVDTADEAALGLVLQELSTLEIETKQILNNHGYGSQEDFEKAAASYESDLDFQSEVKQSIVAECNFDIETALK